MTLTEWQAFARDIKARADRIDRMIVERARRVAAEAGLDPAIAFLHAHNALVSAHYGQPWPGIDYSLARKVRWLERQSWEPGRIADRIVVRAFQRVTFP